MSEKTKSFGAGAILSPVFLAILIGAISMVGSWASKVPQLETTVKLELGHVNVSIERLTDAQISTNRNLDRYAKTQVNSTQQMTQAISEHNYRIMTLEGKCDSYTAGLFSCEKR